MFSSGDLEFDNLAWNGGFLAAAPQMMDVIEEQARLLVLARDTLRGLDAGLPVSFALCLPYEQSEAKVRIADTLAALEAAQPDT